jgi:hypothetical protein
MIEAKEEALNAVIEAKEFNQPLFDIEEDEAQIDLLVTLRPLVKQASQVIPSSGGIDFLLYNKLIGMQKVIRSWIMIRTSIKHIYVLIVYLHFFDL